MNCECGYESTDQGEYFCKYCLPALQAEIERLRVGYDRYETVRILSPMSFADAWKLNVSTGKPFDQIIDELRPFYFPKP